MKLLCSALLIASCLAAPATAGSGKAATDNVLRASLLRDLNDYLQARTRIEHISAISLSISLHGAPTNINITVGNSVLGGGVPITDTSLWQIGSNTKAFTAAIVLQLEAEKKLTIDQTIGRWLPQYPAWKNVTIRRLLNMTSGIPGYDNAPKMLADYAKNPKHDFSIPELIAYVYPTNPQAPKPTTGYDYSNTNYLLAELIIERADNRNYQAELQRRFFRSGIGLANSYYQADLYPLDITAQMPAGYFFNHDADDKPLAPLLGRDMRYESVSWMQGAGGIVSTPEDLTRWVRALYAGSVLAPKQRAELFGLVSLKTGKPIAKTSAQDPRGFGLGVAQMTTPETGTVWFYEGMTLGYRMVHVYFPKQDAVIAFGLNSQPDSKENQSGKLAIALYKTLHAAGRL